MPAANPGSGITFLEGYYAAFGPYGDATQYGGDCITMIAGAAVNVGDAVYQSAANTVQQGATAQNALRVGVVIGGKQTRGRAFPEVKRGTLAANANDWVVVCISGKVSAIADAAINVGDALALGGTAGRVKTTAAAAGTQLGMALTAAAGAGIAVDVLVYLA